MQALILAAGRGSRLLSLTDDKPKCLVEFKGKSLLHWQVSALQSAGLKNIAIVTGYLEDKIQHSALKKKFENKNWQTSNMVASLFCADEYMMEGTTLVSYSDIFYEARFVESLMSDDSDIAITYDINFKKLWLARFDDPLQDLESFKIDEDSFLQEIGKKPKNLDEIQGQFMGLLKFTKQGWSEAKIILQDHDINKLDCTTMLQILITNGKKIKAVAISGIWGEIDAVSDLKLYEKIY